jgi:hypothetical protein
VDNSRLNVRADLLLYLRNLHGGVNNVTVRERRQVGEKFLSFLVVNLDFLSEHR